MCLVYLWWPRAHLLTAVTKSRSGNDAVDSVCIAPFSLRACTSSTSRVLPTGYCSISDSVTRYRTLLTCTLSGRVEFRIFLIFYLVTLPLQLITTGSFLEQGSTALTAITAVHAGFVAATFWALLGNAIVSTQVVEDGTISSLLVSASWFSLAFACRPWFQTITAWIGLVMRYFVRSRTT